MLGRLGLTILSVFMVAAPSVPLAWAKTALGVYEDAAVLNCRTGTRCEADFGIVTADLIVTKVSCSYSYPQNASFLSRVLGQSSGGNFVTGQMLSQGPKAYYDDTHPIDGFLVSTQYAIASGTKPAVVITYDTSGPLIGRCTISGAQ